MGHGGRDFSAVVVVYTGQKRIGQVGAFLVRCVRGRYSLEDLDQWEASRYEMDAGNVSSSELIKSG